MSDILRRWRTNFRYEKAIHSPPDMWATRLAIGIPGSRNPASMPMMIPPSGPVKDAPVTVKISRGSVTTPVPGMRMGELSFDYGKRCQSESCSYQKRPCQLQEYSI